MSRSPLLRTPTTWKGRLFLFVVSVGGVYSAQWLAYWATSWQQIRPSDLSPVMLAVIFGVFSATIPGGRPWFGRRGGIDQG
ncbi:hypothetical protein [Sinomonas sp. ASV322]|uniref:hypothetical protein n=1 Tax=Sinomonas sp. ASV322 TaxID=3041920 RepID=UPI0027DCB055|nr:hypothetical protein [Sinomonas sp. ASV322]MDQ4503809.1 hypothetical protein [Sinomonas sp. ASV322]